jgi:hypothetical protein
MSALTSSLSVAMESPILCKWFGLGIAEITIDYCLPPAEYFFLPMKLGWAVDILRRAALGRTETPKHEG